MFRLFRVIRKFSRIQSDNRIPILIDIHIINFSYEYLEVDNSVTDAERLLQVGNETLLMAHGPRISTKLKSLMSRVIQYHSIFWSHLQKWTILWRMPSDFFKWATRRFSWHTDLGYPWNSSHSCHVLFITWAMIRSFWISLRKIKCRRSGRMLVTKTTISFRILDSQIRICLCFDQIL